MNSVEEKTKGVRRHVNISKVVVELDAKFYKFNLTRKGLVIRKRHGRKPKLLSFSQLLDLSIEQRPLL